MSQTRTFRLLRADEIDVRIGQTSREDSKSSPWYSLLLYKDARADMIILDETVGAPNWKREHRLIGDVLYCSVSVRLPIYDAKPKPDANENGEVADAKASHAPTLIGWTDWASKEDCGTESANDAEKGAASDSFKRACVNWGIGRELYTAPRMFIGEPKEVGSRRFFYVKEIGYDDAGNISAVTIGDYKDAGFSKKFASR